MRKKDILLIGGGGHCKSCIDVIEEEGIYSIKGIIDLPEKVGENILDYPIIDIDDNIEKLLMEIKYAFITTGHITSTIRDRTWKGPYNIINTFSHFCFLVFLFIITYAINRN